MRADRIVGLPAAGGDRWITTASFEGAGAGGGAAAERGLDTSRPALRHPPCVRVSLTILPLVLATAAFTLALGCSTRGADRTTALGAASAAATDSLSALAAPLVPVAAEDVRRLAARPGARATVVNVWATWCAPCREEFPSLLAVARARAREGVRLVLVSADFDEQRPAVRAFLAAHGVADTTYIESGDQMSFIDALSPKWSGALPATFVYDAHGRLVKYWEGLADSLQFSAAIDQALVSQSTSGEPTP
jgi:thiol-disulfide isomerase/thioredoxin